MDSTSAPLLRVAGLSVAYRTAAGARVPALSSVDLEVAEREVVGLLGASGSGKSTLTQAVLRLLPGNAEVEGQISFRRQDIRNAGPRELRTLRGGEIALISQEPALALNPVLSIGRQLDDVLKAHRPLSSTDRRRKIQCMLSSVGFPDPERILRAYPHQLSGGQRQRAAIAQALVCGPALLMADEPLSALDTVTQAEILDLFARLKTQMNLAMIFITHNAGVLSTVADRMVVLRDGLPVASGTLEHLRATSDPYVRGLLFPEQNLVSNSAQPARSPVAAPILRVQDLSKCFSAKKIFGRNKFSIQALDKVNFELEAGATTAIIGRSGSGKSTLARCIAGFEKPDTGRVELHPAVDNRSSSPVQLIFQDAGSSLNPRFTASQIVAEPMLISDRLSVTKQRERALELMKEVGLDPEWHMRKSQEFSGGQRQRLALARALAADPQLLIMDESLAGLDLPLQAQMLRLLLDIQALHGLSYLYISHDLNFISLFATSVIVMDQGRIVEHMPVSQLTKSSHPVTQSLVAAGERVHALGVEVAQ